MTTFLRTSPEDPHAHDSQPTPVSEFCLSPCMSAVPVGLLRSRRHPADDDIGTIGFSLQVAPGVTISTISWSITNTATGFSRSGTVNVQNSNTIRFQVGGLPAGAGYTDRPDRHHGRRGVLVRWLGRRSPSRPE